MNRWLDRCLSRAIDYALDRAPKHVFERVIARMKFWGVSTERDLPPEFIISNHAYMRLKQRLGCNDEKMFGVVLKAWESKLTHKFVEEMKKMPSHDPYNIYKVFLGCVFVFSIRYNKKLGFWQKVLVTIVRVNERAYHFKGKHPRTGKVEIQRYEDGNQQPNPPVGTHT